jgi:ADP-L-glycero-D-manno-heptose 6-epimerase
MVAEGLIEYIAVPPQLVGKYQSFTEADMALLREAGYSEDFMPVEVGVGSYVAQRLGEQR